MEQLLVICVMTWLYLGLVTWLAFICRREIVEFLVHEARMAFLTDEAKGVLKEAKGAKK